MDDHGHFMRRANQRRLATYRDNARFIAGVRWLGTLDASCCVICGALDGAKWDLDGEPIDGTPFHFRAPPIHAGCRCVLSPVPKTFRELGIPIDEPTDQGMRASCEGPVQGATTFASFMLRRPALALKVLGAERAKLLLAGVLTLTDFVAPDCRERSMSELRSLIANRR